MRLPTSNRVADVDAIVRVAQVAEAAGFRAVSVHDHLIYNGWWVACGSRDTETPGDDRDILEALVTLTFVAARTDGIELMTGILLLPVREVVLMAKQVATLDVFSGGRLILGVGVGGTRTGTQAHEGMKMGAHAENAKKEFETFRVPERRGVYADEAIDAMRAIWTDESASFAGEFVQFSDIDVFPKPVQEGGPPILIGGTSAVARRRVAHRGDGWLPSSIAAEDVASGLAEIEKDARECGRPNPSRCVLNIFTALGQSDEDAVELLRGTLGSVFAPDELATRNLVGSPETVVKQLQKFADAGVTLVEMKPIYRDVDDLIELIELCRREVMPAFV